MTCRNRRGREHAGAPEGGVVRLPVTFRPAEARRRARRPPPRRGWGFAAGVLAGLVLAMLAVAMGELVRAILG